MGKFILYPWEIFHRFFGKIFPTKRFPGDSFRWECGVETQFSHQFPTNFAAGNPCVSSSDVNSAFLHGGLDEEVYMKLPPRLSVPSTSLCGTLVCKLQKSLYRLRGSGDSLVILAIYVDDIVLIGIDLDEISTLKVFLHAQFKIKDLGLLNYFFGIEVLYTPSGVLLHQRKFIHDLLKEFCSDVSSFVICPLELHEKLKANMGDRVPSPELYRSLIGKLNFLTHTRPDLSFSLLHPCVPLMKAALHLLRYLKGTSDFGLFFNNSSNFSLQVYCDSDLGSCPDSRRSDTGFCIMLGGSLVAIYIAKNTVFHEQTKHIELDCHFPRVYKCVPGNSSTGTKEVGVNSNNTTATADSATPQTNNNQ
ncbi:uncharacterized mitochondrial protein AtMg00810-like [Nicotiana sylvestris]|uniref:uncharacterized mitochondrial protein AtMg00810-like n=1 Tax=Nicotiana sylvestris TaxID=4096 RepID=UPI00388C8077